MSQQLYDINLERTLLASLIFAPLLIDEYFHKLNSESLFFQESHQIIFQTILKLHSDSIPVEEGMINSSLKKNGHNVEKELIFILTTTPAASIQPYIDALSELADKRQLITLINAFNRDLQDESIQSNALLTKTIDRLENFRQSHRVELFETSDITSIEAEEADFICKSWLPFPKKTVSLISAPGGSGKSWMVLQLMMRHLVDSPTSKAFAWLSEDPTGLTAHRAEKIASSIIAKPLSNFKGRLSISNSPTLQVLMEQGRGVEINAFFTDLKKSLIMYDLIILDPLIAFFGADENNNAHARKFMQLFTEWASKENKTIIFIHHSTKNTTQARGASAFTDAVRLVYEISLVTDKKGEADETRSHLRKISLTKDNYGAAKLLGGKIVSRQIFPETKIEPQSFMKDF
ncbi:AAA family ATPase [Sulfuricurvum sp.]|uniref:AAA family ATPase n=1 Tax=Sulfuricurvum sp. TaxID=2025608 RepID=UPI00261516C8|nr:AAA family ATPase [Sulfuricurvum sp.]MDD2267693.1 AAA family ATPase [Sulfuricurvum sp.]MDD2949179.1 AAA family ATPase [Sulfuricurvum sp.]